MNPALKNLTLTLINLDKKIQQIERISKDLRVEINNLYWELIESKRAKREGVR